MSLGNTTLSTKSFTSPSPRVSIQQGFLSHLTKSALSRHFGDPLTSSSGDIKDYGQRSLAWQY